MRSLRGSVPKQRTLHVQHESRAVSCPPLLAGSHPKAEKQLRRENVTRRASVPLSSFIHSQGVRSMCSTLAVH